MIWYNGHFPRPTIVQMRKSYFILRSNLLPYNNFIYIVEFIPIVILLINVSEERFEFRTSWNGNIECFGSVETFLVKQIKVIIVHQVTEQLTGQSIQIGHDIEREKPGSVTWSVYLVREFERVVVVEPIVNCIIFLFVQFHLNRFQRLNLRVIYFLQVEYCPRNRAQVLRHQKEEISFS